MIETRTLAQRLRLERTPMAPAPRTQGIAIDSQQLERLVSELGDGGKEVLAELIQLFIVDFQQAIEGLSESIQAASWERVAFEAHRLRSSTASLAAGELSLLCKALEQCGQNADPNLAAEVMSLVHEEFPRVREALTAYVQRQQEHASGGAGEAAKDSLTRGLGP